jgi:hypothetical protein
VAAPGMSRSYWADATSRCTSTGTISDLERTSGASRSDFDTTPQSPSAAARSLAVSGSSVVLPAPDESSPSLSTANPTPAFYIAGAAAGSEFSLSSTGATPAAISELRGSPHARVQRGVGTGFQGTEQCGPLYDPLAHPDSLLDKAAMRSQWESAGAVVVGEVRSSSRNQGVPLLIELDSLRFAWPGAWPGQCGAMHTSLSIRRICSPCIAQQQPSDFGPGVLIFSLLFQNHF